MGFIIRGVQNAARNVTRTIAITIILGLSIGLSLIMLLSLKSVQQKITDVKASIGNTVTVSPAGVRGFDGGGNALTETDTNQIATMPNVTKTVEMLNDRLTPGQDTTLVASLEAGSFGQRQRNFSQGNGSSQSQGQSGQTRTFTMPISVTGTSDPTSNVANGSTLKITSGSLFAANSTDKVALIGTDLATKNNLKVGSTFSAYNTNITVAGIFDSGNRFSNSGMVMPTKTVQALSNQAGAVSSLIVQTDSIDSLTSVQTEIKNKLGDKADVVTSQDTSNQAITPLENIKNIAFYGLIGSLVAGGVIILLTMTMIVRERRREIGTLKAIGASNIKIVLQFVSEAITLTFLGGAVGLVLGASFSNQILQIMVSSSSQQSQGGGQGGRMMRFGQQFLSNGQNSIRNLTTTIGLDYLLYGIGAVVLIAVVGSAVPAWFISKVRPAEVMRSE